MVGVAFILGAERGEVGYREIGFGWVFCRIEGSKV